MAERPQRRARTKHTAPRRSSPPRSPPQDFESLHFSDDTSAQRFREKFMGKPVTPSFSLNISEFRILLFVVTPLLKCLVIGSKH